MKNSEKNLQGKSFRGQNLAGADFSGSDLRGADFSGAVLTNADFSKCKTGLKTSSAVLIFSFSLIISLISGYIAYRMGDTVRDMIQSNDTNVVKAGYITMGLLIIFILLAIWKGGISTLLSASIIVVTVAAVLLTGLIYRLSGLGTGIGSLYSALAIILFVAMVFVGTIARATAGTLSSSIIFLIVAIGGGFFGKSIMGGGIGTVVLAISCAIISKRVLSGEVEFTMIKKIALKVGSYFGTSFRNAELTGANFSDSVIKNTDFTGAKLSGVKWENSKKMFSLEDT